MREVIMKVYKYDELTDDAKEKAREWYRNGNLEYEWWDGVYQDAARIAEILGIDLMVRTGKLINGTTIKKPAIFFSGFSSQGDGACFEGSYSYAKGAAKKIRDYAPKDTDLHRIADQLQAIQKKNFYKLVATSKYSGHYHHERSTTIDVDTSDGEMMLTADTSDTLAELLRDFMVWIYRSLEREYDYLNSDEAVTESIEANGYEFNDDGTKA